MNRRIQENADPIQRSPLILIGQCSICKRFICGLHAERLPVKPAAGVKGQFVHLGCPFDPGTPLGPAEGDAASVWELLDETAGT